MQDNNYYEVEINYALTPQMFYGVFLKQMQKFFLIWSQHKVEVWRLYLNLACCPEIEGTVVPNLLTVGYIVGKRTGFAPILYISQRGESKLWNYLHDLRFVELSENNEIYDIRVSGSRTGEGYRFADYCTTTFLKKNLEEEQVAEYLRKRYSKLFKKYLTNFNYAVMSTEISVPYTINILEVFCKQLCYNAVSHGKSFCYTTMQVNHKKGRIFISVSDCGQGMYRTFLSKIIDGYEPSVLPKNIKDSRSTDDLEFRAIIEGLVYRFYEEKYGIWSVMRDIMDMRGILRFHSGKVRVVIADLDIKSLRMCQNRKKVAKYLYDYLSQEEYREKTPFYQGTHIELELPLTK